MKCYADANSRGYGHVTVWSAKKCHWIFELHQNSFFVGPPLCKADIKRGNYQKITLIAMFMRYSSEAGLHA